jgi:pimeloyl-ACP methyl ester carboxylesterase
MPTARARGIDIYYEEYGEGPHLIVAHGLLGSVAVLPRFAERIQDIAARGVHVVAYDARGHGRSGYTTRRADYYWASLAEDMHAFMRALGIDRATVYGGSMGAGTALMLALAQPDAVERLILMSPPPFGDDMRRTRRMFGGLALLYQLLGTHVAARVVAALPPSRRLTTPDQRHDLRSFLSNQRRAAIVPAIRGLIFGPQIPLDRLGAIVQPAIVLTHPDDPIHPLASGTTLRERMPHAKLAVAPSPTYWDEHPDELTRLVAAYVRGESIEEGLPGPHHDHARA